MKRILIECLHGREITRPPFWFMRQAGRYLPEYRTVRASCDGFLGLCYNPSQATEVTLQPLKRFGMDAAIIFSDILVIPHALGRKLAYLEGEGPSLEMVPDEGSLAQLRFDRFAETLAPVYEAIAQTRAKLLPEKALIGFAGAPWTLACYLLSGRGKTGFNEAQHVLRTQKPLLFSLFSILEEAIIRHLSSQIDAGADAVQLFDSWAGLVTDADMEEVIFAPHRRIASALRKRYPEIPIIGFPKGIGFFYAAYAKSAGMNAVGVDMFTPMLPLAETAPNAVLQGNLDPHLLAEAPAAAVTRTHDILTAMGHRNFVFNLGHGILQTTPIETVEAVSAILRGDA